MKGPYGFELSASCKQCKLRKESFFCNLASSALQDFSDIHSVATYPEGSVLFLEKQESRGIFVLCAGEVKLSISSSGGKTLILRIAKAGEVLGLMSTISGAPYELTAETLHPCQVAYVRREDFLRFLAKHTEVYQAVIRQMTTLYRGACRQLRTVGLSASATEKLARLLLDWSAQPNAGQAGTQVRLPLTHSEIAELVGTTRETVTRTLSDFKRRHFVSIRGANLTIADRPALEAIAAE